MSKIYPVAPLTFIAKIKVVQGEQEHAYPYLIAADSLEAAEALALSIIESAYDFSDVESDGSVLALNGELSLRVSAVRPISLPTFLEMASAYGAATYCQRGYSMPVPGDLPQDLKSVASSVTKSLKLANVDVAHGQVLNALASAVGERNWQQYRARSIPDSLLTAVIDAAKEVNSLADDTGCSDGYCVTYMPAIESLMKATSAVQEKLSANKERK